MVPRNADSPPTFNWTDEEKALLRRTLRVRILEEDRIEVEACEDGYPRDRSSALFFAGSAVALAALAIFYGTSVGPDGLTIGVWIVMIAWATNFLTFLGLWPPLGEVSSPVTMFPATPWYIRHRPIQHSLEMLKRTNVDRSLLSLGRSMVPFDTDVNRLLLRTTMWAPMAAKLRVREIVLDRCAPPSTDSAALPDRVAVLVGKEVAQLPRAFYVPLKRYLDVVSVTSETLVVRSEPRILPWVLTLGAEFLFLGLFPGVLPVFGMWPHDITLGNAQTAQLWRLALVPAMLLVGPIHLAVAGWHKRHHDESFTLSKRSAYLVVKDRLGEVQIPTNECLLIAALDRASDEADTGSDPPMAIFLSRQGRLLTKWVLDHPRASDSEPEALAAGLREYLHCPDRRSWRRQQRGEG